MSDCVNAFNTCTFKKIGDELQGCSLGKIGSVFWAQRKVTWNIGIYIHVCI